MSNDTRQPATHCVHGHSLADAYVWKRHDREGTQRRCRVCHNERCLERARKNRAATQAATPPTSITCPCGVEFEGRRSRKWCDSCRRPQRQDGRVGRAYERLKAQVRAEEPTCWICGDEIDQTIKHPHPMSFQLDHIVEINEGGAVLDRDNVHASHARCNNLRSNKSAAALRAELSQLRAENAALRAALNLR